MIKQATLIFFYAISLQVFAQQTLGVFPASPNSITIEKQGNIPIGYYNGSLPIQLPLPSLKTKNGFELPIHVQYNSNGVKVNDYPSTMGMSWCLMAGGLISRTILGGDDFGQTGYYHNPLPLPENPISDSCNASGKTVWNQIIQLSNQGKSPFTPDARPDEFYFRAGALQGKFQYLPDKVPCFFPFVNAQVYATYRHMGIAGSQSLSFRMVDEQQNTYHFNEMEFNTISYMPGGNPLGPYISAVHLTDIVTKDGEIIHFEYETFTYAYPLLQQELFTVSPECGHSSQQERSIQVLQVQTPVLKSIAYHNQLITFNYFPTTVFNDKQMLLQSIGYSTNATLTKAYQFTYDIDILKDRAWLTKMEQLPIGTYNGNNPSYAFEYLYPDSLPKRLSLTQDYWGFFNSNPSNLSMAPSIPEGLFQNNCNLSNDKLDNRAIVSRETDTFRTQYGSLKKMIYPTGGYSIFEMESHVFKHPDLTKYGFNDSIYGAGLRVKSIRSYDIDAQLLMCKKIHYSGGRIMSVPLHFYQSVHTCGNVVSYRMNSASEPIVQTQFAAKGQLVGYDLVEEFLEDSNGLSNGKTSHTFFNQVSKQDAPISVGSRWRSSAFYLPVFDFQKSMLFYQPQTPINNSYSSMNGTLLDESIYRREGQQFQLVTRNEYIFETVNLPKMNGKMVQFPVCPMNTFLNCDYLIYYQYTNDPSYFRLKQKNTFQYAKGYKKNAVNTALHSYEKYEYDPFVFHRIFKISKGNALNWQTNTYSYLDGAYQPYNIHDFYRPNYLAAVNELKNDFLVAKKTYVYNPEWQCIKQIDGCTNQNHQLLQQPFQYEVNYVYNPDRTLSSELKSPHTKTTYLWDLTYDKIGITILNADTSDFAYSSFEPGLNHRINDVINFTEFNETAKTGHWLLNLSQTHLQFSLKPNTYSISFWFKGTPDRIMLDVQNAKIVAQSHTNTGNGDWSFYEMLLNVNQPIVCRLSGELQIDEFKAFPIQSSLTSYNYTPFGLHSVCTPDHAITYYQYDAFGNLAVTANKLGNILQSIQTNYHH